MMLAASGYMRQPKFTSLCFLIQGSPLAASHTRIFFLSDPGVPGVRYMGPVVSNTCFVDLTDVTLADDSSVMKIKTQY